MGLRIHLETARALLAEAVEWAESNQPVPEEWTNWTQRIDASPSKTFTVALGTALLARSANPKIDALALKATSSANAYSARTVGHSVLVPGAVEYGYNLRATGREPLNNQPFFRYDRIDEIDRIHASAKPFLPDLVAACHAINNLDASGAKAALAAFLRIRIEAAREHQSIDLRRAGTSIRRLVEQTDDFITHRPEGGRRGQAFVAAAFDLTSANVRSCRVNDPSRHFPGDVQILDGNNAVLAIEVRQKIVSYAEALQFAEALRTGDVDTGLITMLDPGQQELDDYDILVDADALHDVTLVLSRGVQSVLTSAAVWSGKPLVAILRDFPRRMLVRLEEIDADRTGIDEWGHLFR